MSGTCASGCGCGRGSAAGLAREGAFTRPNFFDGQLLCADDLQALTAYTRAKGRLHNRYLVGSGVVCGLEVVCSRSHAGSVLVRSGYALDCCGNDIVVPCDQTVDITKLVAELPPGIDPCPPPAPGPQHGVPVDRRSRRYELVVEYAETPGELVAPFSTGERCSRGCEPTRFQEGYRFSLRYPADRPSRPPALVTALACCAEAERQLTKLEDITKVAAALATGGQGPLPGAPAAEELKVAQTQLQASPDLPTAVRVAGMIVRQTASTQALSAEDLTTARRILQTVSQALEQIRAAICDRPLESAQVGALEDEIASLDGRLGPGGLKPTRADRLLAEGVVAGRQVDDHVHSVIAAARDWAWRQRKQRPSTHCRAEDQLRASGDDHDTSPSEAVSAVTAAVRQILIDCICAAVNPPCAPCDDEAVVLATVSVEGCDVLEVCNLARRHALTGTVLRYWLPIEWVYCELEKSCCGEAGPGQFFRQARDTVLGLAGLDECGRPLPPSPAPSDDDSGAHRDDTDLAAPPADASEGPLSSGEHRLLRMLNSQMQSMQAKIRKLEGSLGEAATDG